MRTAETEGERLKGLLGQSGIYLIGTVIGQAAGLITFPLFARALGPAHYGTFALITAFVALGRSLVLGGVNTSLIRFYVNADDERKRRVVGSAMGYALVMAALSNLIAAGWGRYLAGMLFDSGEPVFVVILRLGVLSLTLDVFVELLLALARARDLPFVFVLGTTVLVVANIVLAAVFLLAVPMGVTGAVIALVGSNLAALTALGLAQADSLALALDRRLMWTLVAFGAALVPANIASWALNVIDRYMLQHISGPTSVGLYSAAYRVGSIISLIYVAPFHQAWLPHMLQEADSDDGPAVIGRVGRYFFAGGVFLVIVVSALGPEVLSVLAGGRYAGASGVIPMVALGVLLGGTVSVFAPGIMLANKTWTSSVLFVIAAGANVLLNLLLIPRFGMLGAAAATLLAYALVAVGHVIVSQRLYPVAFRRGALLGWLLFGLLVAAVMTLVPSRPWDATSLGMRLGMAVLLMGFVGVVGLVERREVRSLASGARSGLGSALRGWGTRSPRTARMASTLRGSVKHLLFAREIVQALVRNAGVSSTVSEVGASRHVAFLRPLVHPVPQGREKFLNDAERIVLGARRALSFSLPDGSGHYWHTDVLSGHRWPMAYHKTMDISESSDTADPKIPWELSRLHHLPVLGQAFATTGDERFASYARREIENWVASNPVGFGVNWTVAMEAGVLAANLCVAYELMRSSTAWDDSFRAILDDLLVRHAEFVERNIEDWGGRTQNHYIADVMSLAVVGWAIGSEDLPERASRSLSRCVDEQILPDGVDFENSTSYHRIVMEMLVIGAMACRAAGVDVDARVWTAIGKMARYIDSYTRPDGTAPAIGDGDDGRILMFDDYFDWTPDDHRYLLALVDRIYGLEPPSAKGYSGLWGQCFDLSAVGPLPRPEITACEESVGFEDGGMYVMADGDTHAVISCALTGVGGLGPHRHNDVLSYELWMCGPVVVDPGTYTYLRDTAARRSFRSTSAHNVVQVDGAEQNDIGGMFGLLEDRTGIDVTEWLVSPERDVLEAKCTCGDGPDVQWTRRFEFAKGEGPFVVHDRVTGTGLHDIDSFIHLAPGIEPLITKKGTSWVLETDALRIDVDSTKPLDVAVEDGWVSPSFGVRRPSKVVRMKTGSPLPVDITCSFTRTG